MTCAQSCDDLLFRAWLALMLLLAVLSLGLFATRRVIVAWWTYFTLRSRPMYQRPSLQRWLWLKTLAYANGQHRRVRGRR